MKSRGPYRGHSTPFKLQLCQDIRNGVIGRRNAQRTYGVSATLRGACGKAGRSRRRKNDDELAD